MHAIFVLYLTTCWFWLHLPLHVYIYISHAFLTCEHVFIIFSTLYAGVPVITRENISTLQLYPQVAAVTALAAPAAANAVEMPEMTSSLTMSATIEALMLGIVLGTVPITVLGLFVSAWLQFKKGPTLGIWVRWNHCAAVSQWL